MSAAMHIPSHQRSPSYPAIDLGRAVSRAEAIYQHEGRYSAPLLVIMLHWGYSGINGRSYRQFAALKKYGLVEDVGSKDNRQVRLSQLALRIVTPDSPTRAASLRIAALKPAIYRELKERFSDGLPSGCHLRWYLVSQRGFTEVAARSVVAGYRATLRFAGLMPPAGWGGEMANAVTCPVGATAPPPFGPTVEVSSISPVLRPTYQRKGATSTIGAPPHELAISLAGAVVRIAAEFPMTEDSWDQLMATLTALKPGLTSPPG